MKVIFIVFLLFFVLLIVHPVRLPAAFADWLCRRLSSAVVLFHCDSVSFGFIDGLTVSDMRVYLASSRRSPTAMVRADSVSVSICPVRIKATGLCVDRLHDSYYEPGLSEWHGREEFADFKLPRIPDFDLELERSSVLGIKSESVLARVAVEDGLVSVNDVLIRWPDGSALTAECRWDIDECRITGSCEGLATASQIRPFVVTLDIASPLEYIDAFTGMTKPVGASCKWDVDLETRAFALDLGLSPQLFRYRGVPMRSADGKIRIDVNFAGGKVNSEVTVGPFVAFDRRGGILDGKVVVLQTNDQATVRIDVASTLTKGDLLDVIDCPDDGVLDPLVLEGRAGVTAKGVIGVGASCTDGNALAGKLDFAGGSLFGVGFREAKADYAYVGDTVVISNVVAIGRDGGRMSGSARLSVPESPDEREFELSLVCEGAELGEFAGEKIDLGERYGKLDGELRLSGPIATNFLSRLDGGGRLAVKDGHLSQMKIFLGLTQLLADYVPGVAMVVNQSESVCEFTIDDGVITFDRLIIEGAVFSIRAEGNYDMVNDRLDFDVGVRFMRDENWLGKFLVRPILWPFSKLLLDYRLTGSLADPRWEYVSLIDRVL